jgi:hypothetical protein
MMIFACLPGAASASKPAPTPARPTVPVAIGAAVTLRVPDVQLPGAELRHSAVLSFCARICA